MTTPNEELILKLRGQAYTTCRPDQLCDQAADALQSQAERIKELESEVEMWKATANAVVDFEKATLVKQRDTLRAQLAAIAESEPVAWAEDRVVQGKIGAVHSTASKRYWERSDAVDRKSAELLRHPLFTRPVPAQDVTELVEAFEHHIEQTRPIERSTIALAKYKGAKQ